MKWLRLPVVALAAFAACGSSDSNGGTGADAGPAPVNCVGTQPYDKAWTADPNMCVYVFASGLTRPRQMAFAPNGDLFVSAGNVTVLWDANKNGAIDGNSEKSTFATASGLNHGLAFSPDYRFIYASSDTTIYRWPYTAGARAASAPVEVAVKGMPGGGHDSRTLVFDSKGRLYVNVGSSDNVEDDAALATRSQIRRFTIPGPIPSGGIDYGTGEIVARGMRNEVGLFIDSQDHLWGVENGRDDLTDPAHGGNVHDDNPGEEINFIDGQGQKFYGYPNCYSEFKMPMGGKGPGTQWADTTLTDKSHIQTDAWCQSIANVHPPAAVMQAHGAPLGIIQYTGHSLPLRDDLVIASHGSWDRQPAVGRLIVRARLRNGAVVSVDPIAGEKGGANGPLQGTWEARPVDVRQGPDQALYFSDDQGGRVYKVGYRIQ